MATTATLSMKLLVDRKAQRVVFAEAGKEVVDFLFSLLALPLGTAVKLVGEEAVAGSVGNLYASVERLDDAYVLPGAARSALLHPPAVASPAVSTNSSVLLLPAPAPAPPKAFFTCGYFYESLTSRSCQSYVTDATMREAPAARSATTR
ncbi:unnamed protein product [Urochloa humidicola]